MKKEMKQLFDLIPDQIEQASKEENKILISRYKVGNVVWKVFVQHQPTGSIDIKIKSRGTE